MRTPLRFRRALARAAAIAGLVHGNVLATNCGPREPESEAAGLIGQRV